MLHHEMNSPFRYAGGKFYARKLIFEYIPKHSYYVEPFAGGASIFFAKTKVSKNWLNDMDKDLMNCFITIRDNPEKLIEMLNGEEATKERHNFYKNGFIPQDSLESAARWYYLNRTSYSGIMNTKNCYWGYGDKYSMRPENWGGNIRRTSKKLQEVKLTALDFEEVIESLVSEKSTNEVFLFIDPPYFSADQDKFYTHTFTKDDHIRLSEILKKYSNHIRFLLTYDNTDEVRSLYDWAHAIHNKEWNYTINRTDDQKNGTKKKGTRYKGKEIFILNYEMLLEQLTLL